MRITKQQRIVDLEKKLGESEDKKREAEGNMRIMEKIAGTKIEHPELFYEKNGDFKKQVLFSTVPESHPLAYRIISSTDGLHQYYRDFYSEKFEGLLIVRESATKSTQSNQITSQESTLFVGRIPKVKKAGKYKQTEAGAIMDILIGFAYQYAKSISVPNKLEIGIMRPAEPARFEAEWKKTLDELSITPHDYSRPRFLLGLIAGAAAAGGAAYALHHYLG